MNAERLNAILKVIHSEISTTRSVEVLGQLVAALQKQVNQPQQPGHQQEVAKHLETLRSRLRDAPSNNFSPGWRLIVEEIGGIDILGDSLVARLDEIFARNQITVSVALEEIRAIHESHERFFTAVSEGVASLRHFEIGSEELDAGQAEVGVLIPREAVDNSMASLGKELDELDGVLRVFSEIVSGQRPNLRIRTISSSEFQVFLESVTPIAACIAFAVERVVALYEKLLNIRRLRQELQEEDVPDDMLAGVQTHANSLMTQGIEELVEDVLQQFHAGTDEARVNELKIELRFNLKKIANRIDRGYNIEVRAEPTAEEPVEAEENESPEAEQRRLQEQIIRDASVRLRYRKLGGEPILSLPDQEPGDGEQ
ncbi:MAG: hypothetical protein AAGJ50_06560 [Pseudomonadota bacterium]